MNRKIPNKPHPTPNPDKPHTGAGADRGNMAWSLANPHGTPAQASPPAGEPTAEEPTYDSCFDDLNVVLSQSMQQPDPDPNLEPPGESAPGHDATGPESGPRPRGKAPRTSEIFRSVVAAGGESPPAPANRLADRAGGGAQRRAGDPRPESLIGEPWAGAANTERNGRTTAGFPGPRSCC